MLQGGPLPVVSEVISYNPTSRDKAPVTSF